MNIPGYVLTSVLSLAMLWMLALAFSQISHAPVRVSTCWLIVALSGVLVGTTGRIIPGGPFVSFHGDILPVVGCAATLAVSAITFRAISQERRLILGSAMLASLVVIGVVVTNVLSFWNEPFARGAILAW